MIASFLKSYWKPLAIILSVAGTLWIIHHLGYSSGKRDSETTWQMKWDRRDEADRKTEQEQRQRTTEQNNRLSAAQALAASNYLKGVKDGKASADKTIADYRNANLRLQQRFDGLQCISRSVSDPAGTRSVSNAASSCGLSDADVEFLVRFSQRADNVAKQLAAAQKIIADYRAIINGQNKSKK